MKAVPQGENTTAKSNRKAEWVNVMKQEGLDDMTLLAKITNEEIANNIRVRYDKDIIYTSIGDVLISMNPYKLIPIYTEGIVQDYIGKTRIELPPHIFGIAEAAYRAMKAEKENQCVIISGESGAGKTEAAKKIMMYVSCVSSNRGDVERVKNIILETNPLLEAFGNAKTLRNDNSSRFGKYFEIQFNLDGDPVGGIITNFLLEKARVVDPQKGERNFHIFYQFCKGSSAQEKSTYGVNKAEDFDYLMKGNCATVSTIDDVKDWKDTIQAMKVCGITEKEKECVLKLLAAILWLGNVEFKEAGGKTQIVDKSVLDFVASLIGVAPEFIANAMTIRQMETKHGNRAGTNYSVPLNKLQANSSRDAMAKAIYDRMFDWLITKINKALTTGNAALSIGVLDIYGFEVFAQNGFEQFCINYVNERLQQIFIELTLKLEQEEYVREGITWTPIKFFNNKIVCDLIDGKNPPGIFCVLDDVCRTSHAEKPDAAFKDRVSSVKNEYFAPRGQHFLIKHYAGDVTYEIEGMVDKNKDTLFKDLLEVIKFSEMPFLSQTLFPEVVDKDDKKMPTTAAFKIKEQANALVKTLMKSTPHYVRCIKPNDEKKANQFDTQRVLHQIVYLGLLDNLKVKRAGFAYRTVFKKFMDRYFLISKQCSYAAQRIWKGDDISGCKAILSDNYIGADQYQIGKTKIFLRHPETLFHMEDLRENYWHNIVNRIKNAYFTYKGFHGECSNRIKNAFKVWKQFRIQMLVIIQRAWHEYKDTSGFYDRRAGNEGVLVNKKQRNRLSMASVRKFTGDYLDMRNQQNLLDAMGPGASGEKVLFSHKGKIIVHPGFLSSPKTSPRFLCLTEQALYTVMLELVKKNANMARYVCDRKIPISQITGVSLSPLYDDYIIIHAPMEWDVVIECEFKSELIYWLRTKNSSLTISWITPGHGKETGADYLKKKKKTQHIEFSEELAAKREKLKAPADAVTFYHKNHVYTLSGVGLPSSSRPREFAKKGGYLPPAAQPVGLSVPGSGVRQAQRSLPPRAALPAGGGGAARSTANAPPPGGAPPSRASPAGPARSGGGAGGGARPSGGGARPAGGGARPAGGGGPRPAGGGGPPMNGGGARPAGGGARPGGGGGPPMNGGGAPRAGGGPPMNGGGAPRAGGGAPPRAGGAPAPKKPQCRAMYDYVAQEADELNLKEGDLIDIIESDGDWWKGTLSGQTGMFPGNYVEKV